ncbi:organic anion transporter 3-like [Haliotis cracherodii]|uniref:organic anion transporter 3-like n=1 Tax=Haliotis cracherodii TaxID=6455 RepID=UPI0039E78764
MPDVFLREVVTEAEPAQKASPDKTSAAGNRESRATMDGGQPSMDNILTALGSNGRYHTVQFCFLCALIVCSNFSIMNFVFVARDVSHVCSPPLSSDNTYSVGGYNVTDTSPASVSVVSNDSSIIYEECRIISPGNTSAITPCTNGWIFSERKDASIVSEWDLVCGKEVFSRLSQSVLIAGQIFGGVIFTKLADRFGRRIPLIISLVILCFASLALAFSTDIYVFIVLRFFTGLAQMALLMIRTTMVMELYPTENRRLRGSIYVTVWMMSTVMLAPLAYFLRHESWRILQYALFGLTVISLCFVWVIDESLRWLHVNGRRAAIVKILKRAATLNRLDVRAVLETLHMPNNEMNVHADIDNDVSRTLTETHEEQCSTQPCHKTVAVTNECLNDTSDGLQNTKFSFKDIIYNKHLMINFALLSWLWMTATSTYFSLYFTSNTLASDVYLNFVLNSVSDFPSGFLFWLLSDRVGRKKTFTIFYMMSGIGLLASTLIKLVTASVSWHIVATVCAFVGRVFIGATFVSLLLFTTEVYPTNVRNIGLGINSTTGRIGSLVAPFTAILMKQMPWLPGVLMASFCFLSALAVVLLPETRGTELPSTIQEVEDMYKRTRDRRSSSGTREDTSI